MIPLILLWEVCLIHLLRPIVCHQHDGVAGLVHTPQGGSGDERNPAPDMVNIPLFTGFHTSGVSSINTILSKESFFPGEVGLPCKRIHKNRRPSVFDRPTRRRPFVVGNHLLAGRLGSFVGQVGPKFRYFANIESLERKHADDDGFCGVKVLKFLCNSLYIEIYYIYIYSNFKLSSDIDVTKRGSPRTNRFWVNHTNSPSVSRFDHWTIFPC